MCSLKWLATRLDRSSAREVRGDTQLLTLAARLLPCWDSAAKADSHFSKSVEHEERDVIEYRQG